MSQCRWKYTLVALNTWNIASLTLVMLFAVRPDKASADLQISFDISSMDHLLVPCSSSPAKGNVTAVSWMVKGETVVFMLLTSRPNCTAKYCVDFSMPYALRVSNVSINDSGIYQCSLSYTDTSFDQMRTNVIVRVAPAKPTIAPFNQNIVENFLLVLTCQSAGYPTPNITWYKSGLLLQINVTSATNASGEVSSRLSLRASSTDDGAVVACVAENELGVESTEVQLNVSYGPRNIAVEPSPIVTAVEGAPIAVNCSAEGKPTPLVSWKYANASGTYVLFNGMEKVSLNLSAVQRQDAGSYVCVASNMFGNRSSNVTLDVNYKPSRPVVQSNSTSYTSGDNITLVCAIENKGYPSASYNWTKGGTTISAMLSVNTLILSVATAYTSGPYTCIAFNIAGWMKSESFNLTVYAKPVIFMATKSRIGYLGQPAMLNCSAEGNLPPTIHWLRSTPDIQQGVVTSYSNMPFITTSVLRIESVGQHDFGTYACYANNSHGNDSSFIELVQPSVPQAPQNLSVVAAKWTTVMLTWLPLFNGGYEQWFIVYRDGSAVYNGSAPSFTVTGLQPGEYNFSVKSQNFVGLSNSSSVLTVTLEEGPSASNFSFSDSVKLFYTAGLEYCLNVACTNVEQPINNCTNADADASQSFTTCTPAAARWCLVDIKPLLCGAFSSTSSKDGIRGGTSELTTTHIIIISCVVVGVFLIVIVSVVAVCCVKRNNSAKSRQQFLNESSYDTSRSDTLGLNAASETPYATYTGIHAYPNPNFASESDDGIPQDDHAAGSPPRHDYVYAPVRRLAVPPAKVYNESHANFDDLDGSTKDDTSSVSEPPPYQPQVSVADSDNASAADSKHAKRVLYEVIV